MQLGLRLDAVVTSHPPYHPNVPQQTFQPLLEFVGTSPWRIRNLKYLEIEIEEWLSRAKWGQAGPNRTKWCQMVPNRVKQGQMGSKGAKKGQNFLVLVRGFF